MLNVPAVIYNQEFHDKQNAQKYKIQLKLVSLAVQLHEVNGNTYYSRGRHSN